jgi:hypothetical protein
MVLLIRTCFDAARGLRGFGAAASLLPGSATGWMEEKRLQTFYMGETNARKRRRWVWVCRGFMRRSGGPV